VSRKYLNYLPNPELAIAFGVAALLRVIYWISVADEPWFQTPGMDPEFYYNWASSIIAGYGAAFIPFPRAPLYSYILAGILKFLGSWWLLPRLFNLVCDLTTIWVVWSLACQLAGKRAGLIAALLFGFCGMAIYQSGELLMTSLETALAAVYLLFLVRTINSNRTWDAVVIGIAMALFALCRPNALLLILTTPLILLFVRRKQNWDGLRTALTALIVSLTCLTPVTYLNFVATGRLIPVATQGGVNFFIGNARGANGWASSLPGVGADWVDSDASRLAELSAGQKLDAYAQSQQLWKMGIAEIKSAPTEWLGLMVRKTMLLLNMREIGNNRSLTLPIEAAPFLRILFLISLGGLFPLAIVGFIHSRKNHPFTIGIVSFVGIFGGSLLLFFISSRYRMPLIPAITILAGIGAVELYRQRSSALRIRLLIPICAGLIVSIPPWAGSKFDSPAQGYFAAGNALLKQNRHSEAIRYYSRTASLEPEYPKLHLNTGVALMSSGDTARAIVEFQSELSHYPNHGEARNNLAVIAEKKGDLQLARQLYLEASQMSTGLTEATDNLLRITLRIGDESFQKGNLDSAEAIYLNALELSINDPRPCYRLALLSATNGNYEKARDYARQSLSRNQGYEPARMLLQELLAKE